MFFLFSESDININQCPCTCAPVSVGFPRVSA